MTSRFATVAGRAIPVTRLEERLAKVRRGPRGRHLPPGDGPESVHLRRWLAIELVNEAVLDHEARVGGITNAGRPGRLAPFDLSRLIAGVTAHVTIAEADARAYYERNPDLYRHSESRRIRHALVPDERSARSAAVRLGAGEDLPGQADSVAVRRGELTGPLEDAIFGAAVGAVVGPLRTEHAWHAVRIEAVTAAFVMPFAEARPAIEAELLGAARVRAFDEWLERRRRVLAVIEPAFQHPGHPSHGVPSHRH